jgi:hypothetical protein
MSVSVAALLRQVLLSFKHLRGGNHPPVATDVLLERGSHPSFTGLRVSPSTYDE